jgi:hypothetical protein
MASEHTSRIRRVETAPSANAYLLECGHRVTLPVPPYRQLGDLVECAECRFEAIDPAETFPDGFRSDRSPLGEILESRSIQAPATLSALVCRVLERIRYVIRHVGPHFEEAAFRDLLFTFARAVQDLERPRDLSADSIATAYREILERQERQRRQADQEGLRLRFDFEADQVPTAPTGSKFVLRTKDAPAAGGRTPGAHEREFCYVFPLEDGRQLYLEVGAEGRAILERVMLAEMLENARGGPDSTEDGRK